MKQPRFYVYLLIDPRTNSPFYVGKGKGDRIQFHEQELHAKGRLPWNQKLERKIKKIWSAGLTVKHRKIFQGNEPDCLNREVSTISKLGLENLCNLTQGGIGGDAVSRRFRSDPAMRQKWRDVQLVQWTDKSRMEFGRKIKKIWRTKASRRASHKKHFAHYWSNPVNREKQRLVFKKYWANPANRKRQSENAKKAWRTPRIRKKILRAATHGKRLHQSKINKIFQLAKSIPQSHIAKRFNVSCSTISLILRDKCVA